MFGMMEALLSFLRRQVGLRTDVASATGSLHAKVKDVKDSVQSPRGPAGAAGSFMTTSTNFVTVLDITGKGRLVGLLLYQTSVNNPAVVVTVDGDVLANGESSLDAEGFSYPSKDFYLYAGMFTATGETRNAEINFKTSLKLQLKTKTIGDQAMLCWLYELE